MDGFLEAEDVALIAREVPTGAAQSPFAALDALVALMQARPAPSGAKLPAEQATDLLACLNARRARGSLVVPTLTGQVHKVSGRAKKRRAVGVLEWDAGDFDAAPHTDVVMQGSGGRTHHRGPVRSGRVVGARVYGTGQATKARVFGTQAAAPKSAKVLLRRDGTVTESSRKLEPGDILSDVDVHGLVAAGRTVVVTGEYGSLLPFPARIAREAGSSGLTSFARALEGVGLTMDEMDDLDWGHVASSLLKTVPTKENDDTKVPPAQGPAPDRTAYDVPPLLVREVHQDAAAVDPAPGDAVPDDWPALLVISEGQPRSTADVRKAREQRSVSDALMAARDAAYVKTVDAHDLARGLAAHADPKPVSRGPPIGKPAYDEGVVGTDEGDEVVSDAAGEAIVSDAGQVLEAVDDASEGMTAMASALGFAVSRDEVRALAASVPPRDDTAVWKAAAACSLVRHLVVQSAATGRLAVTRLHPEHAKLFSSASPLDAVGPSVSTYVSAVLGDVTTGFETGPRAGALLKARVRHGLANDRELAVAAAVLAEVGAGDAVGSHFWAGFRPDADAAPVAGSSNPVREYPSRPLPPQRGAQRHAGPARLAFDDEVELAATASPTYVPDEADSDELVRTVPGMPAAFAESMEDVKRVISRSAPTFVAALGADPLSKGHTAGFRGHRKVIEAIMSARNGSEAGHVRVQAPRRGELGEPVAPAARRVMSFLSRLHEAGGAPLVAAFCAADASLIANGRGEHAGDDVFEPVAPTHTVSSAPEFVADDE